MRFPESASVWARVPPPAPVTDASYAAELASIRAAQSQLTIPQLESIAAWSGGAVLRWNQILRELVARDLKVRYKRSALGILWTMLNPLLLMGILAFVFSHILRVTIEHFPIYILSALVLWNFFAQATSWSTACFLSYAPIIKKIYVPQAIFVLATVLAGVVNLLISLVPLAIICRATRSES